MVLKVFSNLKNSVILYFVTADAPAFPQGVVCYIIIAMRKNVFAERSWQTI